MPITLNPPQANDLQQHASEPSKTQNSKIPERHTLFGIRSPITPIEIHDPLTFIPLTTDSGQLTTSRHASLVFSHPSTYHKKVYA
jgi:hypothetical protein